MLKKIALSLCFLLASVSSLFALGKGSFIFYPQAGFGISDASAAAWGGNELNSFLNTYYGGSWTYKDSKIKNGVSWSMGLVKEGSPPHARQRDSS